MKYRNLIPVAIAAMISALIMVSAAPVEAQVDNTPIFFVELVDYPDTIQPGGSYNVTARVTRPSGMVLPAWGTAVDQKWEVRVYFYDGLNCYNKGEWVDIEGTLLYDGWWNARTQGGSWTASMDDTREFTISVNVVDHPRPQEDINQDMNEIPVGKSVSMKARFRLRGMEYTPGENTFTYYGQTFGASTVSEIDEDTYRVGSIYIEKSAAGYWQIDYDERTTVSVSEAGGGAFAVPTWALIALGVIVLVVVIAVAAVKLKGRGPEAPQEEPPEGPPEEFPGAPPSPETPPPSPEEPPEFISP